MKLPPTGLLNSHHKAGVHHEFGHGLVHLAARPQVNLRSIGRKRYAHLSEEDQDEIHVVETVPWGEDTLFTLEFREDVNKYAVHTCNNQYLQKDGKLTPTINNVSPNPNTFKTSNSHATYDGKCSELFDTEFLTSNEFTGSEFSMNYPKCEQDVDVVLFQ